MSVIRVNFRGATDCLHCGKPVDNELNLGDAGRWHWKCWVPAHPRGKDVPPHIDTSYFENDDEMGTGWYAIIRDQMADLWCGPYETETRAVDSAKKKIKQRAR